ncbi:MAG: ROK family protein [Campylobacterota bacterium]
MNLLIDYGGTKFRYCQSDDLQLSVSDKKVHTLASQSVDIKAFLKQHIDANTSSVRISFAGQVANGTIKSAPNIGIKDLDLQAYIYTLNPHTQLFLQNDLNCAALAESAVHGGTCLGVFYVGTGFGMAVVHRGELLSGAHNLSNEIGHLAYKKTPFVCSCGSDSCLELTCSGKAIERRCHQIDTKNVYNLSQLHHSGDEKLHAVYVEFMQALSFALHCATVFYDFDRIVLGGSVMLHNPELKNYIQKQIKKVPFYGLRKDLKIELSNLVEGSLEGTRYLR